MPQQFQGMSQTLQLKAQGLHTNENLFSEVPPGSLRTAINVSITRESIVQKRRGVSNYGSEFPEAAIETFPYQLFFFKGGTLTWTQDATSEENKLVYDNAGTWTDLTTGDITLGSPPYSTDSFYTDTFHFLQTNKNLYISTNTGIKKLCNVDGPLLQAGGIDALDGQAEIAGLMDGWMDDDTAVAYRITWSYTDDNDNLIVGEPSERIIVTNSSGFSDNVNLVFTVPKQITQTGFTYSIYRSFMTATAADTPSDELQLALEDDINAGQIVDGIVQVTDATPQSLLGRALYTNAGQQGIAYANATPPVAQDMALFNGLTLYANTLSKQRFFLTLLAVGGVEGIQEDDTLTLTTPTETITLTGKASENITNDEFLVYTGGTPAENIDTTARSIVRVLNRSDNNTTLNAFYDSELNELPGQILLEEINIGGGIFNVESNNSTAWNPKIDSSVDSSNDHFQHRILVSKFGLPEAVPLIQSLYVGSENYPILRIIPLRTAVIVLKGDGVFKLTGSEFPLQVSPVDLTIKLIAAETAVTLNNAVYCYSDHGVVTITEVAPQIISRPIENQLNRIFASSLFSNINYTSYGTAYESDKKYLLLVNPTSTEDQFLPTIAYVYDLITDSWTNYVFPVQPYDVSINPVNDSLYLASGTTPFVMKERKTFTRLDFADGELEINISAYDEYELTVDDSTGIAIGDTIAQLNTNNYPNTILREAIVTEVPDSTHIIVDILKTWDTTEEQTSFSYNPIPIDILYTPQYANSPTIMKHWSEFTLMFLRGDFTDLTIYFSSSFSNFEIENSINPKDSGGWGLFPWGDLPWGGGQFDLQPIRNHFPREIAKATWINFGIRHSQALAEFLFLGVGILYTNLSTRIR
jgi:hypothetical protein